MQDLVEQLGGQLLLSGWIIGTAESCTAGMVAQELTSISGSSRYFDRSFVTYSNQAKIEMLGVSSHILKEFGAVSDETAHAMLDGVFKNSPVDVAISITGIAGPSGGSPEKPVGLVYIGTALRGGKKISTKNMFYGDRQTIREITTRTAILQTLNLITDPS